MPYRALGHVEFDRPSSWNDSDFIQGFTEWVSFALTACSSQNLKNLFSAEEDGRRLHRLEVDSRLCPADFVSAHLQYKRVGQRATLCVFLFVIQGPGAHSFSCGTLKSTTSAGRARRFLRCVIEMLATCAARPRSRRCTRPRSGTARSPRSTRKLIDCARGRSS